VLSLPPSVRIFVARAATDMRNYALPSIMRSALEQKTLQVHLVMVGAFGVELGLRITQGSLRWSSHRQPTRPTGGVMQVEDDVLRVLSRIEPKREPPRLSVPIAPEYPTGS